MKRTPSGAETYWQRYASENSLGRPLKVERGECSYKIIFPSKTIDTPFVGGPKKLTKLVADIQRWIDT